MKNRLEIAKKLLANDGSIWISISDTEMHYLKVLADGIFGEESFVGTLPRKTRDGKSDVPFNLSQDFDWLLVYTNGNEKDAIVGREIERKYYETEDFSGRPWRTADLSKQTTVKERPNSDFTMINPKTGKEYPVNPKRSWAVTKDTFQDYYDASGIGFPDDYDFMSGNRPFRRVFKEDDDANIKPTYLSSDFIFKDFLNELMKNTKNKKGNEQIDELFSRDDFDYAKPEELLKLIIQATTKEEDIVLDFFMGSATTQAVAMKMNRQFIGVEQMDYINTVSVPRLQKVIEGEQGGISKDVGWEGGGSFVYAELYELNQVYINEIQDAINQEDIEKLLEKLQESDFLNLKVDLNKVFNENDEFFDLALDKQKAILIQVLDNNQLYLSYSEIDDDQYAIDKETKAFNASFYNEEV